MKKLPFRIPSSVKVHSLTSFCIKMYIDMACIVMYDNISIARSKRVNEKVVLCYTVQDEDQFPCKSSGLWIISYDRYGLHYNVLLGHIIGCFTRNKRVNE